MESAYGMVSGAMALATVMMDLMKATVLTMVS